MDNQFYIIDKSSGNSRVSLLTLESALKVMSKDYSRDCPIKIFEIRNLERRDITSIGFYLKSPNIEALVGESFWVPERKRLDELGPDEGGFGTLAYRKAISLIYRYLNSQPRILIEATFREINNFLINRNVTSDRRSIETYPIIDVVEEDESTNKNIMRYLYPPHDYSFIVLDIETEKQKENQEFILGCTWDFFHGIRVWEFGRERELMRECDSFDKIVTFNGEQFDLGTILRPYIDDMDELISKKSLDIYRAISRSFAEAQQYRQKGESTLANIAFATLNLVKWEVMYEPDTDTRREPIDDGLIDHCARDVEMTRDLFFYIIEKGQIYYITKSSLHEGRIVRPLPIHLEFFQKCRDVNTDTVS